MALAGQDRPMPVHLRQRSVHLGLSIAPLGYWFGPRRLHLQCVNKPIGLHLHACGRSVSLSCPLSLGLCCPLTHLWLPLFLPLAARCCHPSCCSWGSPGCRGLPMTPATRAARLFRAALVLTCSVQGHVLSPRSVTPSGGPCEKLLGPDGCRV